MSSEHDGICVYNLVGLFEQVLCLMICSLLVWDRINLSAVISDGMGLSWTRGRILDLIDVSVNVCLQGSVKCEAYSLSQHIHEQVTM